MCQKVFGSKGLEKQNKAQQKGVANASCLQCSRRAFLLFRAFFCYSSFSSPSSTSFRLSTSSVPFPLVSDRISSSISLKQPGSIRHTWNTPQTISQAIVFDSHQFLKAFLNFPLKTVIVQLLTWLLWRVDKQSVSSHLYKSFWFQHSQDSGHLDS